MVFEQIEKLKQEYTDKYVRIDADRPELARFKNVVGRVKTVNMSGRALVEFDDYHLNTGWYDIHLDYLKVVDKPAPQVEAKAAKPAAKKPAPAAAPMGEKKLSPLELARQQGAAKKAVNGDAPAKAAPVAQAPASEKPKPAGKLSVAEMLAAARGQKAPAAATPAPAAVIEEPVAEAPPVEEVETEPASPQPAAAAPGKIDKKSMSIADMLAWCRTHDAK